MKRFLFLIFFFLLTAQTWAGSMSDAFSRTYWVNHTGITTGSVNDIIFKYLGNQGYIGALNDRLYDWLSDQTGLDKSTHALSDLMYQYFVLDKRASQGNSILLENGDFALLETGDHIRME